MMENTKFNKARLFAQYLGCANYSDGNYESEVKLVGFSTLQGSVEELKKGVLLLKPLSAISDEDAIEVAKMYWGSNYSEFPLKTDKVGHSKLIMGTMATRTDISDYLRSKSYALPWNNLSVETMIEFGWITLEKFGEV